MHSVKKSIGIALVVLGIVALAITVSIAAYSDKNLLDLFGVFLVEILAIWGGITLYRQ